MASNKKYRIPRFLSEVNLGPVLGNKTTRNGHFVPASDAEEAAILAAGGMEMGAWIPAVITSTSDTAPSTLAVVFSTGWSATSYQWNLNGTAISGATSSTYAATTAGIYTVTLGGLPYSPTSKTLTTSGVVLRSLLGLSTALGPLGSGSSTGLFTATAANTMYIFRTCAVVVHSPTSAPRLRFENFWRTSSTATTQSYTPFTKAININYVGGELGGSSPTQITFGGSGTVALPANASAASGNLYTDSDPIPGLIGWPAGTVVPLRISVTLAASGDTLPNYRVRYPTDNSREQAVVVLAGGTDPTATGVGAITIAQCGGATYATFSTALFGPVSIVGAQPDATKHCVYIATDSIGAGSAIVSPTITSTGVLGYAEQAFDDLGYATVSARRGSDQLQCNLEGGRSDDQAHAAPGVQAGRVLCDLAFIAMGTNDFAYGINGHSTGAQLIANLDKMIGEMVADGIKKIIIGDILCRTTDNANTAFYNTNFDPTGGGTPANAGRTLFNNYIQTLVGNTNYYGGVVVAVNNLSSTFEDPNNLGKWLNTANTVEGTHLVNTADQTARNILKTTAQAVFP